MVFEQTKEDLELVKPYLRPDAFVITKEGLRKIVNVSPEIILTVDKEGIGESYSYDSVIPIIKGFKHLEQKHLFDVIDIITDNKGYRNYKPNFHFLPHFIEVTEESIELKIQIFQNFDIVYCDNLISNIGSAYQYLVSKNYDVHSLHKKGLVIIDSDNYGTKGF